MRRQEWTGAVVLALVVVGWASGGEPPCSEPHAACSPWRLGPAGGWDPYGGGLLHWWPPHCFPRCGGPDDYCRKPLPRVCVPPYPPYYIWGPPEVSCPHGNCPTAGRDSHD
jgi:hypothetical protein